VARCSGSTASRTWPPPNRSTSAARVSTTFSFGCADRDELVAWGARLDELGIAHGEIQDAGYGSGLSFRDPDNIALELFAPPA
jgi:hypothetical protein